MLERSGDMEEIKNQKVDEPVKILSMDMIQSQEVQ